MDSADVLALRRRILAAQPTALARPAPSPWLDDLKLFAVTALGGLVFFGTLIA